MTIHLSAEIWRKYAINGVAASGANPVSKDDVRAWGTWLESLLSGGGPGLGYATKANADADLVHAANTLAIVYNDSTAANNGLYKKLGASAAGSWTRIGDLPFPIVLLTVTGGSGDAITTTSTETPQSPGSKIFIMIPTAANTGGACTLANNGGSPVSIKNALGSDPAANTLVSGVPVVMIRPGSNYQLVVSNPVDTAGVVASCTASASAAAASAAALGNQAYTFDKYSDAQGATVPVGIKSIRLMGYAAAGDGPPASYFRVNAAPSGANKIRTTDRFKADGTTDATNGGYWQMVLDDITDVRKYGVIGDGSTDVTTKLNGAIAAGNVVIPPSASNYILSGDITIPSNRHIWVKKGATIINTGGRFTGYVPGGGNILFQIDGVIGFLSTASGGQIGDWFQNGGINSRGLIELGGSQASSAKNLVVEGSGEIYSDYVWSGVPVSVDFTTAVPRRGIQLTNAHHCRVQGLNVHNMWGEAIYFQMANATEFKDVQFIGNYVHECAFNGLNFNCLGSPVGIQDDRQHGHQHPAGYRSIRGKSDWQHGPGCRYRNCFRQRRWQCSNRDLWEHRPQHASGSV